MSVFACANSQADTVSVTQSRARARVRGSPFCCICFSPLSLSRWRGCNGGPCSPQHRRSTGPTGVLRRTSVCRCVCVCAHELLDLTRLLSNNQTGLATGVCVCDCSCTEDTTAGARPPACPVEQVLRPPVITYVWVGVVVAVMLVVGVPTSKMIIN